MVELIRGDKWAITWSEDAPGDGFQLECPKDTDGNDDTPKQARFLAALYALMSNDEFCDGIMEWFEGDFAAWKKRTRRV